MARHLGVEQLSSFFTFDHLPNDFMREVSAECCYLKDAMLNMLPDDNPELTAGLRKLLEAKDCFVRAAKLYQDEQEKG